MTNLAGGVNIGELNACVLRVARLNANCHPTGGANGGIVTAGLVTLTADPDVEEGQKFEPKNGCGTIKFVYDQQDVIKRWNLSGELLFSDHEFAELAFGGGTILGAAGGDFAGTVIGHYDPLYSAAERNGIYLEVITTAVEEDAGSCVASDGSVPVAIGHVFGKAKLRRGSMTFANDVYKVTFVGKSSNNPNLFNGPWNDYPGAGYAPNSGHFSFGYTQTEYDAIVDDIAPGYQTLPTGS